MTDLTCRIRDERDEFEENIIATSSPQEVYDRAYEICWRDEIVHYLWNAELTEEQEYYLLNVDGNLLDLLYDEWIGSLYDTVSDIEYVVRDFCIAESNSESKGKVK